MTCRQRLCVLAVSTLTVGIGGCSYDENQLRGGDRPPVPVDAGRDAIVAAEEVAPSIPDAPPPVDLRQPVEVAIEVQPDAPALDVGHDTAGVDVGAIDAPVIDAPVLDAPVIRIDAHVDVSPVDVSAGETRAIDAVRGPG